MKIRKTWAHIFFCEGEVQVEVMMNYEDKSYTLMTENEDQLIAIKSESDESIQNSIDKAKCATAALKYIKQEFGL